MDLHGIQIRSGQQGYDCFGATFGCIPAPIGPAGRHFLILL